MTRHSNGSARAHSSPAIPPAGTMTPKAHKIRRRGSIDVVDAKVAVDLATAQSYSENVFLFVPNLIGYTRVILAGLSLHFMSYHPRYCTLLYGISCLLDAVDGLAARALGQTSKFGAVLDMVTDRCTTSCLLCYLSSAYPSYAILFQFLIALDFSSHYMHMYSSLVTGSRSHKLVTSDVSRILWYYYNDSRTLFFMCAGNELFFVSLYLMKWIQTPFSGLTPITFRITLPRVPTFSHVACSHGYPHLPGLPYQKCDQRRAVMESKQDPGWCRPRRTCSGTGERFDCQAREERLISVLATCGSG
ncbi:CDP-alcohol phosphatidyltransferase-domain-containing protein [Pisolithus orientalis]|uniref:CDP-alcohol phosphatidyltransferase-domain-containing protein n=1 Tax=Pisolithus orientalis TaxID=936130 RepID=UPI00222572B9|nr:CDP-alcohol phosphatidyltransferase-domain-containing protein [Pisolithus orientalis]KAI6028801.1 CDP-alcohol phosphatidyltransferase-domain-containing protein [Pisolithus orientalis]